MQRAFLDFLVSSELIYTEVADRVCSYAQENHLGIIASLVKFCDITESRIAREISRFYELPRFDYTHFDVDQVATELVSGIVSVRMGVLPYKFGPKGELYVVCSDPDLIVGMLSELEKLITGGIRLEIGPLSAVRELAAFVHYGRSFSQDFNTWASVGRNDSGDFSRSREGSEYGVSDDATDVAAPNLNRRSGPVPDEAEVDRRLARLASLNQSSEPMLWDDEDTVVKRGIARDESLKDFFLRNITARVDPPELDEKRRRLINAEVRSVDEGLGGRDLHLLPSAEEISSTYERTPESRTPTIREYSDGEEVSLLVELVRHSTRIEQLEEQVSELRGEVERLGRVTNNAVRCLHSAGFGLEGLEEDSSFGSS